MSDRNTLSIQNVLIYGYGVMGKAVANTFTKANFKNMGGAWVKI